MYNILDYCYCFVIVIVITCIVIITDSCPIYAMLEPSTQRFSSQCGVILSPNYPGLAPPGLWFWVFTLPEINEHLQYAIHVFYVRGPNVTDESCLQTFKRVTSLLNLILNLVKCEMISSTSF